MQSSLRRILLSMVDYQFGAVYFEATNVTIVILSLIPIPNIYPLSHFPITPSPT